MFFQLREVPGLKKKPSTSELLDWLKLVLVEDMPLDVLQDHDAKKAIPPLYGRAAQERAGRDDAGAAGLSVARPGLAFWLALCQGGSRRPVVGALIRLGPVAKKAALL